MYIEAHFSPTLLHHCCLAWDRHSIHIFWYCLTSAKSSHLSQSLLCFRWAEKHSLKETCKQTPKLWVFGEVDVATLLLANKRVSFLCESPEKLQLSKSLHSIYGLYLKPADFCIMPFEIIHLTMMDDTTVLPSLHFVTDPSTYRLHWTCCCCFICKIHSHMWEICSLSLTDFTEAPQTSKDIPLYKQKQPNMWSEKGILWGFLSKLEFKQLD